MFLEYDPFFDVYRFRFGHVFTDWRGIRYTATMAEAKSLLAESGCCLGRKSDSRTWPIITD